MNFSGEWTGFYIYLGDYDPSYFGERVDFNIVIHDETGKITGVWTEKPNEFSVDEESKIDGFSKDGLISFTLEYPCLIYLSYEGETIKDYSQKMSLIYNGEYDNEANVFFGGWHIEQEVFLEEKNEDFLIEGNGIWKMTRKEESNFDKIYQHLEKKFTNIKAIKNTVLFEIRKQYIHINGNGSANSLAKAKRDADCIISITETYLLDILEGKTKPIFLMNKQVKTTGDIGVAMKIEVLLLVNN
ncbi:MAG: putative sterol carrier protein [Maribacter sp.]|jgi:putative sterol carrier protein